MIVVNTFLAALILCVSPFNPKTFKIYIDDRHDDEIKNCPISNYFPSYKNVHLVCRQPPPNIQKNKNLKNRLKLTV